MSVIEAMALAYLDALAPGGFRDAEEREAAALRRIAPMRAALAEARKHGWQLVPVEPTNQMADMGGRGIAKDTQYFGGAMTLARYSSPDVEAGNIARAQAAYRAMLAAAPSVEDS